MQDGGDGHSWFLNGGPTAKGRAAARQIYRTKAATPVRTTTGDFDMPRSTTFLAALAAAAATTATLSFPAYASEITRTAEVHYDDLDLASKSGAEALTVRVQRAAKRVCNVAGDRSLEAAVQSKACAKLAIARVMPQVELALANAGTQLAENSRFSIAAK
jgi:UrcA family protein